MTLRTFVKPNSHIYSSYDCSYFVPRNFFAGLNLLRSKIFCLMKREKLRIIILATYYFFFAKFFSFAADHYTTYVGPFENMASLNGK